MPENETYSAIRCPEHREHGKYELCGRLLGATKDNKIYLYCEMCKKFYEIVIKNNDTIEMTPLSQEQRLKLKTSLRMVN